jgi:hypothetical protein
MRNNVSADDDDKIIELVLRKIEPTASISDVPLQVLLTSIAISLRRLADVHDYATQSGKKRSSYGLS